MQVKPLYISLMVINRYVKLFSIYNALHIFLNNIFIEKEKYHESQICRVVTILFQNIAFKLQEYYITVPKHDSRESSTEDNAK